MRTIVAEPDMVEMESPTRNSTHKARALWYVEPGRVELRDQQVFRRPGEVLLRMVWSGISRGTERLIFRGQVPPAERYGQHVARAGIFLGAGAD